MSDAGNRLTQLYELAQAQCEGVLSAEQHAQLESLVHTDPILRRRYVLYMQMHAAAEQQIVSSLPATTPAPSQSPALGVLARIVAVTGDSLILNAFMLFCVTLGAIVTGTMVVLIALMIAGHRPTEKVAQLTNSANCQWVNEQTAPTPGDDLAAGRKLELNSGLAELVFQSGAKVLLQGPASFELVGDKSCRLYQGSLSATCETPSSKGFEIDTPGMKYTDLGTEFGVMVTKDGVQEVHVFRGEVQAEVVSGQWPVDGGRKQESPRPQAGNGLGVRAVPNPQSPIPKPSSAPLILAANQAIRIAAPGKPVERIAADEKRFVRTEDMAAQATAAKAKAPWKAIGDASGIVGMAAVGGKLFACTADKKLLMCDPAAATVVWQPIGDAPGGVTAMGVADGKLFASIDVRSRGRLLTRDAVETSAAWKDVGHAWYVVAMAGTPGKVYGLVHNTETSSEPLIMVRDSGLSKTSPTPPARTAPGLDGLPWTATKVDRRPPMGALAMTEVGGKFYVATQDDKLFVGNPTKPDVKWQEIGGAPGVTCLAGGDGKLFAITKNGKLLMMEVK